MTSLDATLLDWFAQQRNETFDSFFRIVTWLGSIVVLVPPVVTGMLLLTFHKRISEGLFLGVALFGTIVIVHVSKLVAARPRPRYQHRNCYAVGSVVSERSFGANSRRCVCKPDRFQAIRFWLVKMARTNRGAMHISSSDVTIYLQVHYPSDVLAGTLAAGLWVFGLAKLTFLRE